ncbi:hypothetical protein WJX82_002443 [Trebouxia sp. C0006]
MYLHLHSKLEGVLLAAVGGSLWRRREVVLALWCLVQEAIWLEAGIDGYSLDAFKPASEHTYTIRVTPNIATGLTRPGPQDSGSLRQKLASVKT